MLRGLEGRRIAVCGGAETGDVTRALEQAGAQVTRLGHDAQHAEEDWHGGKYAALVVGPAPEDDRVVQLLREFLVSEKPVVVHGDGATLLERAGGQKEDVMILAGGDVSSVAAAAVTRLADRLDEQQVDEMSDLSFPASDPPAATPAAIGARKDPAQGARNDAARGEPRHRP